MDHHNTATAEALRWLGIAEKLLATRDLIGSKTFAIRARDSDPRLEPADQILAIVDILLASEKRINNQPDWYAILQLGRPTHDRELIASHYRRLVLLLNPNRTRLPFIDQAFKLILDAWSVLSNPTRKTLYDNEISLVFNFFPDPLGSAREPEFLQPPPPPPPPPAQPQQLLDPLEQQIRRSPRKINIFQVQSSSGNNVITGFGPYQPPPPPPPAQQQQQEQEELEIRPSPRKNNIFQVQSSSGNNEIPGFGPIREQQYQRPPAPPPPTQQPQRQQKQQIRRSPIRESIPQTQPSSGNTEKTVAEERPTHGKKNQIPSFWTACPYCFNMYEYPRAYAECTLLCQNCWKAFQGVVISSPPPIVDGKEAYFCCWGFFPIGVSMSNLQKGKGGDSKWTPFWPMFTSPQMAGSGNGNAPKNRKSSARRIYIDDDDAFVEISESSDESDEDWGTTRKRKKKKRVKGKGSTGRHVKNSQADKGKTVKGGSGENSQAGFVVKDSVGVPNVSIAESSKKAGGSNARKQPGRAAKDLGRLDLNVEFSNEAEEPAAGNRTGHGEVDNIEGIGFFEGLDEFLSSLPILSVVGDDKVKAA